MKFRFPLLISLVLAPALLMGQDSKNTESSTSQVFVSFHMISISERDAEKLAKRHPDPLAYEAQILGLWRSGEAEEKFQVDARATSLIASTVSFSLSSDSGDTSTPFSLKIRPIVEPREGWTELNIHMFQVEKDTKVRTIGASSEPKHPFGEYHSNLRLKNGSPTLLASLPSLDGKDQLYAIVTASIISEKP